jgi:integrase/recombinase XerD
MLSDAVNRPIELYRGMGFKYKVQAYMLHSFAEFAQGRSEEFVQTASVLEWAAGAPSVRQRHDRLLAVWRGH